MKKLTKKIAKKRVKELKKEIGDPESAHYDEEWLYIDFVTCLSTGMYDSLDEIKEVAKIIISTKEISFPRWYA